MNIFKLSNESDPKDWKKSETPNLQGINIIPFKYEDPIHFIIENNVDTLFDLELVSHKFKSQSFLGEELEFDSLCWDHNDKIFVIIEYKVKRNTSLIDQGMSYLNTLLNRKFDVLYKLNENIDSSIKINDVNWDSTKIIFISQEFTKFQLNSVSFKNIPFELWEIKRFSNNTVSIVPKHTKSRIKLNLGDFVDTPELKKKSNDINKVTSEIKDYDESYLLENCNEKVLSMWEKIRNYVTSEHFMDTRFNYTKSYNRFSLNNNSPICYFKFQKSKIKIEINGGTDYRTENRKGKYYVELDDPKGLTTRKERLWTTNEERTSNGIQVFNVKFVTSVSNMEEVDDVLSLIRQKYDRMVS